MVFQVVQVDVVEGQVRSFLFLMIETGVVAALVSFPLLCYSQVLQHRVGIPY